jgi:hypothetical protein
VGASGLRLSSGDRHRESRLPRDAGSAVKPSLNSRERTAWDMARVRAKRRREGELDSPTLIASGSLRPPFRVESLST